MTGRTVQYLGAKCEDGHLDQLCRFPSTRIITWTKRQLIQSISSGRLGFGRSSYHSTAWPCGCWGSTVQTRCTGCWEQVWDLQACPGLRSAHEIFAGSCVHCRRQPTICSNKPKHTVSYDNYNYVLELKVLPHTNWFWETFTTNDLNKRTFRKRWKDIER